MTSFSSSEEKKNVEEKNLVVSYKNENSKISYKRKPTPKKDDTKLISFKKNEEKPKEKEKENDNLKETSIEILKEDFKNFIKTHPSIINKKILIKDDKVKIYQVKNAETVVKRRSKKNSVEIVKEEQKVSFKNQNQEKIKIKENKVEPEKKKDIISTADSNIAQKNQDSNKQVTPTFEKVKVGPVEETIQSNQKVEQNEKQQGGRVIDLPDEKPIEQNDQKQQPTYEEVASKNVENETFEDEQKESHETSENQKEEINEHGSKKVAFVVKKLHDESFEIVKEEHPVLQKEQYHYKFKKRQEKQTEKEEKEIEDRKFLSRPFEEETKEVSPVHEPHKVIVIQKGRIHPFSKQHMPESFGDQNNNQSLESKNESPVDNENKLDVQTNEDHYLQNTGMVLSSEKLQNIKITGSLTKDNLSIKPVSLIFEKVKLAFVLEESTKNDQVEQQKQQDSEEVKEFPREKESHKTIENQQKESHETSENQQKEINEHGIKKVAFVVKKLHDENFEIVKEELHVSHKHQHHYKFKKKQKKEKETSEKIVGYNFIPDSNISQTIDQDSEKPITPTFEKVKVAPVEETIQSDQKVEQNEKQEMEGVIDLPDEKPIEQSDQKVQPTYEEIASKNVENEISEDEQKESHKTSENKRDTNETFVNQKEESNDKEPKIVEKKFDEKPKEVTEKPKEKPKKEKKNLINVLDEETKERSPMTDFRKERVKHKGRRPSTNHLVSQSSEDQNNNQSFKSENKFYGNVGNLLDVPTSEDYSLPKRMPSDENFLKRSEIDDSKVKVAPVEEKIQSDQKVEQNEKQQGGRVIDLPEEKPIEQSDQKVQPTYEEIASKNVENEISEDEQKESHITSEKKRDSNKTSGNQQKESKKVGSVKIEVVKEEDKEENQQKIDDKEDIEETKEASQLIDFRKERVKHKMRRHSISNFVVPETSERDTNKKIEQSPSNIAQQKHKKAKLSPTNENTNQQILESNVKGEDETNEKRETTESDSNKDVKVTEDKNRPTYEEIVMKNIENESDDQNKTKNINQDIVELKEKKLPEISVDNQHKPTYEEIVMENLPQKSTDNFQKTTESDKNKDFSEPKINQDLVRPYTPTFEKVIVEKKDVDIFELPEKKLSEITKDKETTENLPDQSESNKDENLVRPFTPSFEKVTVVPSKRSPSFGSKDTKSN